MDNSSYEGWSNYETWCAALWINNEQVTYEESRQIVADEAEGMNLLDEERHVVIANIAERLQDWHDSEMPECVMGESVAASLWSDLLQHAFGRIDWHEIATSFLSEYADA